ncbi:MAG: VWA domain-containing protein [Planctomycetes bacterium]|nr:VWA domain-containing protein [Planctomycetota bacterium]MCB9903500.1 VWA domain-containing protein [Planctomycetota bacterium]
MRQRAALTLCLLALLPVVSGGVARAAGDPPGHQEVSKDPVADLRQLTAGLADSLVPNPNEVLSAEILFHDLRLYWSAQENRQGEIAAACAEWVGTITLREAAGRSGMLEANSAQRTVEWFGPRLDDELVGWIGRELALVSKGGSVALRAGACRMLTASQRPGARMALFAATRDPERLVRDTALGGLVGRDDQAVHTLLIDLLADAEAGKLEIRKGLVEEHFRSARIERTDAAFARVLTYVRRRLVAEDWRRASRAISVGRCLEHRVMLGPLIESLPVWMERGEAGLQAKRIQGDLLDELQRRTGRKLGLHPERWRVLLEAVRRGELDLDAAAADGSRPYSEANFFGLRPWTDRVVFVIDRSGSMAYPFSANPDDKTAESRHEAAIAQLVAFLQELGPLTKFDVVLFSSDAQRWRKQLVPVTPENLRSVASWAIAADTGGGTHLRAGIELAAERKRDGTLDLAALEADTVIVLCDGDTDEGPSWVSGFLQRVNDEARLRFHAVQIGGSGDGTLRALCEGSDGDWLRVDG